MKNFKNLLILAAALLVGQTASAQLAHSFQTKIGMSSVSSTPAYQGSKSNLGFGIGYGIESELATNLFFQPSIFYMYRSFGYEFETKVPILNNTIKTTNNASFSSIELPLNFLYKFGDASKSTRFFIGGGPNIGFRIGGKQAYQQITYDSAGTKLSQNDYNDDIAFGNDSIQIKAFVFGMGLQAGLEFSQSFQVGLEWLGDFSNYSNVSGQTSRTNIISLRAAYVLGGRNY